MENNLKTMINTGVNSGLGYQTAKKKQKNQAFQNKFII